MKNSIKNIDINIMERINIIKNINVGKYLLDLYSFENDMEKLTLKENKKIEKENAANKLKCKKILLTKKKYECNEKIIKAKQKYPKRRKKRKTKIL